MKWEELTEIYENYMKIMNDFEDTGSYISSRLRKVDAVHSLRFRVKNPEHLIEKIIRKKIEDPDREITIENYKDNITDLIGVRVLHLFKEDWEIIHNFITEHWEFHELNKVPTANVRSGDSKEVIKKFEEKGCIINEHKFGYRSVHYIVKSQPAKKLHLAEIQVRTIFEEGFSEIDHHVRYPYYQDDVIIENYLSTFNRLAGSADEMGSFVKILKDEMNQHVMRAIELKKEKAELTEDLNKQINKLKVSEEERQRLQKTVDDLTAKNSISLPDCFSFSSSNLSNSPGLLSQLMNNERYIIPLTEKIIIKS